MKQLFKSIFWNNKLCDSHKFQTTPFVVFNVTNTICKGPKWQVSHLYILVYKEQDILEHTNGKYPLCTLQSSCRPLWE